MNSAEVKCSSFRRDCFSRENRRDDKDEYFVPQEVSKWFKYKTKWCHTVNKGRTCLKGDACFNAHSFNELREPDAPILLSIKKKVKNASYSSKWNKIHLTKEMEEDYKSVKSKCEEQKAKIAELIKENNDLIIENNNLMYSLLDVNILERNNIILQNNINGLENQINSMQLILNEKDEAIRKYQRMIADSIANLKTSEANNETLHGFEQKCKVKIKQLTDKVIGIRNAKNDVHYFEFYDSLISDIKGQFDCPLTMIEMTKPHILPSGNTINEDTLDELIRRRCFDPFSKNFRVQQKIVNRFASDVQEIIKNSETNVAKAVEKRKEAERAKLQSKSVEVQADLLIRSEEDIAYIERLSSSFSELESYCNKLEKDIMDLKNNCTNLSHLRDYFERDLRDARDLLPTSTQKFILLMLNQSRGTDSYNTISLLGYLIFASLRNRFAMGLCYLIKEMDKLNKQRLEKEITLREIEEKEQLAKEKEPEKNKKGEFNKAYSWMFGSK